MHTFHCRGLTLRAWPISSTAPHAPLNTPQSERNSLQTSLGEAKRALAAARESHERHLLEHQAELKSCEAAAAEARTREVAELRDAAARWEGGRVWRWDGMLVATWNAGAWCCSCWWAVTRCTLYQHGPPIPTNCFLLKPWLPQGAGGAGGAAAGAAGGGAGTGGGGGGGRAGAEGAEVCAGCSRVRAEPQAGRGGGQQPVGGQAMMRV